MPISINVKIPETVTSETLANAIADIEAQGFDYSTDYDYDPLVALGEVISQETVATEFGDVIVLIVSLGASPAIGAGISGAGISFSRLLHIYGVTSIGREEISYGLVGVVANPPLSPLTVDTTLITVDTDAVTADATET